MNSNEQQQRKMGKRKIILVLYCYTILLLILLLLWNVFDLGRVWCLHMVKKINYRSDYSNINTIFDAIFGCLLISDVCLEWSRSHVCYYSSCVSVIGVYQSRLISSIIAITHSAVFFLYRIENTAQTNFYLKEKNYLATRPKICEFSFRVSAPASNSLQFALDYIFIDRSDLQ